MGEIWEKNFTEIHFEIARILFTIRLWYLNFIDFHCFFLQTLSFNISMSSPPQHLSLHEFFSARCSWKQNDEKKIQGNNFFLYVIRKFTHEHFHYPFELISSTSWCLLNSIFMLSVSFDFLSSTSLVYTSFFLIILQWNRECVVGRGRESKYNEQNLK